MIIEYISLILLLAFLFWCIWGVIYLVIFQAILWYGVPYVPTPDYRIEKLLSSLDLQTWQKFLDIGCGDGRVVESVAQKFSWAQCIGIENSPYPYYLAKKRRKKSLAHYEIKKGNFFWEDISEYNVIYCYLLPSLMKKVWKKIQSECKEGTLLYSSAFEIPWKSPEEKIFIKENTYFYVYKL